MKNREDNYKKVFFSGRTTKRGWGINLNNLFMANMNQRKIYEPLRYRKGGGRAGGTRSLVVRPLKIPFCVSSLYLVG